MTMPLLSVAHIVLLLLVATTLAGTEATGTSASAPVLAAPVLATPLTTTAADPSDDDGLAGLALVSAHCDTATVEPKAPGDGPDFTHVLGTFHITHVYAGPDRLRDATVFSAESEDGYVGSGPFGETIPVFAAGEAGFWLIVQHQLDAPGSLRLSGLFFNDRRWPLRSQDELLFRQANDFARTIESYHALVPSAREPSLEQRVLDPNPLVAGWAARLLVKRFLAQARPALIKDAEAGQLLPTALVIIDHGMRDDPAWRRSPTRSAAYLLTVSHCDQLDELRVLDDFDRAFHGQHSDDTDALTAVLTGVMRNPAVNEEWFEQNIWNPNIQSSDGLAAYLRVIIAPPGDQRQRFLAARVVRQIKGPEQRAQVDAAARLATPTIATALGAPHAIPEK